MREFLNELLKMHLPGVYFREYALSVRAPLDSRASVSGIRFERPSEVGAGADG